MRVQSESLDSKHQSILKRLRESEETLIAERDALMNEVPKSLKRNEWMDLIKAKTLQMNQLQKEKKKYFLENARYVFHYFESKKQMSHGNTTVTNNNAMNSFFRVADKDDSETTNKTKAYYQQYWLNVTDDLSPFSDFVQEANICLSCKSGEMISQEDEGILICNNMDCAKFVTHIVDASRPSTKDPPNEVSYTAYVKLNHFKEILSQFQAKETTHIPDEIIERIRSRIKKERIKDLSTLNYDKMRDILRKLGLNKYFEHIQYINSVFGIAPPVMNDELVATLCMLFIEIQKPWAVHCPPERSNFFNYTYTLYQLCMLLGQLQYLPFITMLKDREKQLEQDMIWKKVCHDLNWEFFPTV